MLRLQPALGLEQAGGDLEPGGAERNPGLTTKREQEIRPPGFEQRVLRQRSRRHQPDDFAADRTTAGLRASAASICSATATLKPRLISLAMIKVRVR